MASFSVSVFAGSLVVIIHILDNAFATHRTADFLHIYWYDFHWRADGLGGADWLCRFGRRERECGAAGERLTCKMAMFPEHRIYCA